MPSHGWGNIQRAKSIPPGISITPPQREPLRPLLSLDFHSEGLDMKGGVR